MYYGCQFLGVSNANQFLSNLKPLLYDLFYSLCQSVSRDIVGLQSSVVCLLATGSHRGFDDFGALQQRSCNADSQSILKWGQIGRISSVEPRFQVKEISLKFSECMGITVYIYLSLLSYDDILCWINVNDISFLFDF